MVTLLPVLFTLKKSQDNITYFFVIVDSLNRSRFLIFFTWNFSVNFIVTISFLFFENAFIWFRWPVTSYIVTRHQLVFFFRSVCFFLYHPSPYSTRKKEKHWFLFYIQSTSYKTINISYFFRFSKKEYGEW
jgi:hypothetical protein